jgi:hypothetical protein
MGHKNVNIGLKFYYMEIKSKLHNAILYYPFTLKIMHKIGGKITFFEDFQHKNHSEEIL